MKASFRSVLLVAMLLLPLFMAPAYAAYQVGDRVAEFELNDAYGNLVKFSDFAGRVVVLNFWTPG